MIYNQKILNLKLWQSEQNSWKYFHVKPISSTRSWFIQNWEISLYRPKKSWFGNENFWKCWSDKCVMPHLRNWLRKPRPSSSRLNYVTVKVNGKLKDQIVQISPSKTTWNMILKLQCWTIKSLYVKSNKLHKWDVKRICIMFLWSLVTFQNKYLFKGYGFWTTIVCILIFTKLYFLCHMVHLLRYSSFKTAPCSPNNESMNLFFFQCMSVFLDSFLTDAWG